MAKVGEARLLQIFSDIKKRGLTDGMFRTLIQSLWRDKDDNACMFSFKFEVTEAFTFVCPEALKFTSMEHQQTNVPALSVALNTDMAKYDNLIITPDAVGLVILKGVFL